MFKQDVNLFFDNFAKFVLLDRLFRLPKKIGAIKYLYVCTLPSDLNFSSER